MGLVSGTHAIFNMLWFHRSNALENRMGNNSYIGNTAKLGENVVIEHNCIIEDGVTIGDNTYIDSNSIIRCGTTVGSNSFVGANSIIGELGFRDTFIKDENQHKLIIGDNALIRSGSILYSDSTIGNNFQTGHRVTIREKSKIGSNVSVGTLSDIQGYCDIGDYVRLHSNVHIGQLSKIECFVWIYPYVVLTNDPTPPSEDFMGVIVHPFAILATGALIMPGVNIGQDALVAAGSIVTRNVEPYNVVAGNPARKLSDIRKIKNKITGNPVYPWRQYFKRAMPWENEGFTSWYNNLSVEDKRNYNISSLIYEKDN